jgi:hypothetical protein
VVAVPILVHIKTGPIVSAVPLGYLAVFEGLVVDVLVVPVV